MNHLKELWQSDPWVLCRMTGFAFQCFSTLLVLYLVVVNGNATGISRQTQQAYALVYWTRFLVPSPFALLYKPLEEVFLVVGTGVVVYFLKYREPHSSRRRMEDNLLGCWPRVGVVGSLVLAIIRYSCQLRRHSDATEPVWNDFFLAAVAWNFSYCMETVACLPQLVLFHQSVHKAHSYPLGSRLVILSLALYRYCYVVDWMYHVFAHRHSWTGSNRWEVYFFLLVGALQLLQFCHFWAYHVWSLLCCMFRSKHTSIQIRNGLEPGVELDVGSKTP